MQSFKPYEIYISKTNIASKVMSSLRLENIIEHGSAFV